MRRVENHRQSIREGVIRQREVFSHELKRDLTLPSCPCRLRTNVAVVTIGVLLGIGAGLCWYVPVVVHTGWHQYQEVMHQHSAYWFATDTAFSPGENSNVARRIRRFFVEIWGGPLNATVAYVPAVAGLLGLAMKRHWRTLGLLALSFVPFMLFTTVLNTPMSAPLYSFGSVPFFTGLAAAGLVLPPQVAGEAGAYFGICVAGLVAISAGTWSYPTIKLLRKNASPSVPAMRWIEAHLDPTHDVIYYSGYFTPHLKYYLPQFKIEQWDVDWFQIPQFNLLGEMAPQRRTFALAMSTGLGPGSTTFRWPKGAGSDRLRTLSLGRYFEAQVADVTARRAPSISTVGMKKSPPSRSNGGGCAGAPRSSSSRGPMR